ncbi:hypothetical protein NEUTE1DRAFT_104017 [Neurospora tetrasperma FGSC 2508]|uniref:Uncharacterized protein n=1 Tax=Neurospora tetrasperma (strain FGSC 2508 / ATCC MYA-4615 / P0657) TaxID=510951 RepID=F8MUU5_NEUT8|nr:uncharacterized protein NEUTE1DRAFT_104017 [Neurospora tetrasperma FGSC 2508]EGO54570.1 hypothetical protein NEUTE1DRAFT_104017 [Neurospora tetrasperma FGSC 2508]EGZ67977.1 hypothetical protein NEUTE2DRAFT_74170 [Neurospora tetrasperma FGSC 2509]
MRTAAIHNRGGQLSSRQLGTFRTCTMRHAAVSPGFQRFLFRCHRRPAIRAGASAMQFHPVLRCKGYWTVACDDELRAVEDFPFLTLETRPPLQYPCKAKSRLQATFHS